MAKLNFDLGLERFYINNDKERYLEFNPLDATLYSKFIDLQGFFDTLKDVEADNEKDVMQFIIEQDKALKERLDNIFGVGSCKRAFGDLNLFTPTLTGGTIFENFIEALMPIIEKNAEKAHQQSSKRIKKYTEKYKNGNL